MGRLNSSEQDSHRFTPTAVRASMQQLLARISKAQSEVTQLNSFYRKNLIRLIKAEERSLKQAEKRFTKLKQQIYNLSRKAQVIALERVEGYLAQMTLGPTLSHFWFKEQASENLVSAIKNRVNEVRPLQNLSREEDQSPRIRSLDLVDPIFKSFIVDPLPDLEKDISRLRKRNRRPRSRRRQF